MEKAGKLGVAKYAVRASDRDRQPTVGHMVGQSVTWWITLHSFFFLVGPTVTGPEQDPLAVLLLDNRLYMSPPANVKQVFLLNLWDSLVTLIAY